MTSDDGEWPEDKSKYLNDQGVFLKWSFIVMLASFMFTIGCLVTILLKKTLYERQEDEH